ncbi:hypothetical protein EU537_12360 [Candidatus Thorarchaeota archaeon]|nr:MAG: hypothetical protein EU537_12360 [Candidatus Thorarchaeota archaeon]
MTLSLILDRAADEKQRMRFFGYPMNIIAEGFISDVGEDIVGIAHKLDSEADEYVLIDAIIKVQKLGEYTHF